MNFKIKQIEISIQKAFIVILIISALFFRAKSFFSNYFFCYFFVIFHEASHIFMACILGNELTKLNIKLCGAEACILFLNKSILNKLFIYIAGPLSNIILAYIFRKIPLVFEINLSLAIINLIPIYPLDGYRILESILSKNSKLKKSTKIINNISIILLFILAGVVAVLYKNISIIMLSIYIKLVQLLASEN